MEYAVSSLDKYLNSNMDMFRMLKSDIRDLALQKIHLPALLNIPLFHPDFSVDFLKKISRIVKIVMVKPMEVLFDVHRF